MDFQLNRETVAFRLYRRNKNKESVIVNLVIYDLMIIDRIANRKKHKAAPAKPVRIQNEIDIKFIGAKCWPERQYKCIHTYVSKHMFMDK